MSNNAVYKWTYNGVEFEARASIGLTVGRPATFNHDDIVKPNDLKDMPKFFDLIVTSFRHEGDNTIHECELLDDVLADAKLTHLPHFLCPQDGHDLAKLHY